MNANFVNIKVDREERPDIDAIYIDAVSAMTGHAGWPMTCVLTPDGAPFFAGTFFPREQFAQLLTAITELWHDPIARQAIDAGQRVLDALARSTRAGTRCRRRASPRHGLDAAAGAAGCDCSTPNAAASAARPSSRRRWCSSSCCAPTSEPASRLLLAMVARTGEAMARGGMYDQLGGGFARYSVDADWVVPHFEKMLYDNALLLRVYLHWWRISGDPLAWRVAARDGRLPAARPAHPRGRIRVGARRRHRRGRRRHLRVDAAAAGRRARSGRRRLRGTAIRGLDAGHIRARRVDPAAVARSRAMRGAGRDSGPAARGARAASATGARRQGRHVLERPRDRRPGRGVGPTARSRATSTPRARRLLCCSTSIWWTGGCGAPRATVSPGQRPPSPTITATWPTGCSSCIR